MTRETKVGLLAGMALILLIGILVSDHLSVGQRDPAGGMTGYGDSVQTGLQNIGPQSPANESTSGEAVATRKDRVIPTAEELADRERQTEETPQRRGGDTPAPGVDALRIVKRTAADRPGGFVVPPRPVPLQKRWHVVSEGETLIGIARFRYGDDSLWPLIQDANPEKIGSHGEVQEGARIEIPELKLEQVLRNDTTDGHGEVARVGIARQRIVVQPGQTLGDLARVHLGSARFADQLFEANRHVLADPDVIRAGTELRLPMLGNTKARRRDTTPTPAPAASRGDRLRTYTVQPGDTLFSIAKQKMGKASQWRRLYEANRRTIRSPDALSPGMKLRIPSNKV